MWRMSKLRYFNSDEFKKILFSYGSACSKWKNLSEQTKKFKLSDITYLKADEDWSKI